MRKITIEEGSVTVRVPQLLGIDEEMRNWSFFMVLEHNGIVNRGITAFVQSLARGEEPQGAGAMDMKKDVLPSTNPGEEQIQRFQSSVEDHLQVVSGVGRLGGSN